MTSSELPDAETASAPTPSSGDAPFHGLRWGIKPSFLSYVSNTPDGRGYLNAGAGITDRNELLFPLDERESPADTGADRVFTFGGDVCFTAHMGMLYVRITAPRIVLRGDSGELIAPDPASGSDVRLVTFTLAEPVTEPSRLRWEATDVQLTPEGVPMFGDVYQAGEPFAPLTITAAN
ncbi:HtaA domain-containing protein [Nocardia sp. alder85J]|uniref:HtaA domain-containing protein n=1 Tax=Nocardia sp. alder85J TaxID=2862949 RepID=UPI001CD2F1ED|nr:HtaA domain-containing protein [Nocardia sp. alder85J]MCX4098487.1 HtaA domain-containing protein [Nocardia sp. alder85J]